MSRQSPEILATIQPAPDHYGRGVFFMVLSLLLFTTNTLLLKYIASEREVSIWLALFARSLVGFLITLPLMRHAHGFRDAFKPMFTDRLMIWRGIVGVLGTACYYWTVPQLGAGKATLIGSTYILFAAVLAVPFLKESLSRGALFWIAVAFTGVILLTGTNGNGNGNGHGSAATIFGFSELIALAGALNAAVAVVIIRRLTVRFGSVSIYFCQCTWLVIVTAPLLPFFWHSVGWFELGLIAIGGIGATVGQIAMNQGYRYLPVATGASIQMALPVTASIGGILLFSESFGNLQLVGAALIVTGCYLVVAQRRR